MQADIAIIGGGAVGCAIARQCASFFPTARIAVIEKNGAVGLEASGRNSGVLHSGIHQDPSFLKTKLAVRGSVRATAYARERGIPLMECGMLIPVTVRSIWQEGLWRESGSLMQFLANAKRHGIAARIVGPRAARKLEPHIHAIGGVHVPHVVVLDSDAFVKALMRDAVREGVSFLYWSAVEAIHGATIHTSTERVEARVIVNAAGVYADAVARMAGIDAYRIYPWRGEYYEVCAEKADLVKGLVYPATHGGSGFKGIHFSPRPDGRLFIGPNARMMEGKEMYEADPTPPAVFYEAVRKFCPELEEGDLTWAYSGIRAKRSPTSDDDDYIIRADARDPLVINCIGIDSPGLTASMAIGEYVAGLIAQA